MSRAEKKEVEARVAASIERKRARGEPMVAVPVEGRRGPVSSTFWGRAWCERMEACGDYRDRLPLGRSRLRAGAVYDLGIAPREVFAYVAAEELYEVLVRIQPLSPEQCATLAKSCAGRIGSLVDLLSGRLSAAVVEQLIHPESGLIPGPKEIRFDCNCADHAGLCLHSAAVLYAVGAQLDADPGLLFTLREIDLDLLVSGVVSAAGDAADAGDGMLSVSLNEEDLPAIFGIQLEQGNEEGTSGDSWSEQPA